MSATQQLFDPTDYGAYHDGIRDDSIGWLTLAALLTWTNGPTKGNGGTVLLSGTPRIRATMALPAPVNLLALPGTRATADTGVTVTVNGKTTGSEQASTTFAGAGTWTFISTPAIAGGTANVPISAATPAAETFGAAGTAGASGQVSDAGHIHPLAAAAGGDLAGSTYPNPVVAAGVITAAKLAAGAATGAALGADVATLTGAQSLTNKTFDSSTKVLQRIAETTLGASQAQIVFSSIPQGFRNLLLTYHLRDDSAGTLDSLLLQVNSDAGAHYNAEIIAANGTTLAASEVLAATSLFCGYCVGGGAGAGLFAAGVLRLLDYANTVAEKVIVGDAAAASGGTTGLVNRRATTGIWASTAAISGLTVLPSSGNLVAGSVVTLYGEP